MIPPFWPLSEGLMAGLASRAPEWKFWSLTEKNIGEIPAADSLAPFQVGAGTGLPPEFRSLQRQVELRVLLQDDRLRTQILSPDESPSQVLQGIFQKRFLVAVPSGLAQPTIPTLRRVEHIRQKNSRGEFEEFTKIPDSDA